MYPKIDNLKSVDVLKLALQSDILEIDGQKRFVYLFSDHDLNRESIDLNVLFGRPNACSYRLEIEKFAVFDESEASRPKEWQHTISNGSCSIVLYLLSKENFLEEGVNKKSNIIQKDLAEKQQSSGWHQLKWNACLREDAAKPTHTTPVLFSQSAAPKKDPEAIEELKAIR